MNSYVESKPPTKVVLLNGPPGSGKDEGAKYTCQKSEWATKKEFKKKLYDLVMLIYDVPEERFWKIYSDRVLKEAPLPEFEGLSVRQAMIKVSEEAIKPNFGSDYFGKSAAKNVEEGKLNIFSDSGFIEEVHPLVSRVGADNILLIRILGRGSFEGDSRDYLNKKDFKESVDIHNTQSEIIFLREVNKVVQQFYGGF